MGKKFAEYSKFDLSEINKEVLKKWDENQVFARDLTEREGCPLFRAFLKDRPLRQWHAGYSPCNGALH